MYEAHAKLREEKRKVSKRDLKSGRADVAVAKLLSSLKDQVGPNASLLDYGAGEGTWSIAAEKLGFKVVAYEPHSIRVSSSVDHASRWCEIEREKFDVIICNQVLEHLNRPSLAVERLKAVSHQDTLIFVSVPNARKLSLQVLARSWPYNGKGNHVVAPFQHLQGFSMKSLLALMARQEFRVDLRAQILLGPVGWRRLVQIIFGKLWVNVGTTALLFKWVT